MRKEAGHHIYEYSESYTNVSQYKTRYLLFRDRRGFNKFNIMANVENIFETNNTFTAGNLASNIWIVLTSKNKTK